MNTSTQRHLYPSTHLFTVRLWVEALGEGQGEVRMQVQHVLSGETRYFREWKPLISYLLTTMQEVEHNIGCKKDDNQ